MRAFLSARRKKSALESRSGKTIHACARVRTISEGTTSAKGAVKMVLTTTGMKINVNALRIWIASRKQKSVLQAAGTT